MRDRARIRSLRQIATVRRLQMSAAEKGVAEAQQARRRIEEHCRERADQLGRQQDSWSDVVSAPNLSLALMRVWAVEIQAGEDRLSRLKLEQVDAEARSIEAAQAWRLAMGKAESAEAMACDAERRWTRRRDDVVLQDISDRFAWRTSPS